MTWVATGYVSSGDSLAATRLPNDVSTLPESAIRKYRAAYYGERMSDRINLLMQQIIGDLAFCLEKLEYAEEDLSAVLPITVTTYCDKD